MDKEEREIGHTAFGGTSCPTVADGQPETNGVAKAEQNPTVQKHE